MQGPPTTLTEDDEASIPTEHERNGPSMNPTITVRRKAAKRTLPWKLAADEIQLALAPPQDEDTRATKRPRLEKPVPTSTDGATTEDASHKITVALPPSDATTDHADSDPVTGTPPNARTTGATGRWTLVEDAKLIGAVTNTRKKKKSKNWAAIAALVPGRTKNQCENRWRNALNPSIDQMTGTTGKWKEEEDTKLKAAVQTHGGKNWVAVAALVPGRTKIQCKNRWHDTLDPSTDRVNGSTGFWKEGEDIKLKNAVQKHGGKHWAAIAALITGRTNVQCYHRWHTALDPSIDQMTRSTGKWEEEEDFKLKAAVQTHGGKDWVAIAALVPGRTINQCYQRWHNALDSSIDGVNKYRGKWKDNEDIKLKAAVHAHGDKDWVAIAALVPGRTKKQCWTRWKNYMDPNRSTVQKK
jgi:hypothetical protein